MPVSKKRKKTKQQGIQTVTHKRDHKGNLVKLKNTKQIHHSFTSR